MFTRAFLYVAEMMKRRLDQKNEIVMLKTLLGLAITGMFFMAMSNSGLKRTVSRTQRSKAA